MVPEDTADRLYAAPPEGFVAARDEAVAAARAAGDLGLAKEIAKLRKPTIAAWLVNLLALRRPDLVAELAELAEALRAAQRDLKGDQLRELSTKRRTAVSSLVSQARELALEAEPGMESSKLPLAEVEATLTAALADTDVATQLRSGRLVRAVSYAGFGEVPRPRLRLVTGGAAPTKAAATSAGKLAAAPEVDAEAERAIDRAALRRELAAARTGQKRAEAELERAAAAEDDGARALAKVVAQMADLEKRRSAADQELSRRKLARKSAERGASAARRRVGEAEGAMEAIESSHAPDAERVGVQGRADRKRVPEAQSGG
jgi:hypothetical protein